MSLPSYHIEVVARHSELLITGISRGGRGRVDETSVMYSTAYDGVDIGISYERLAIPAGAPPPYTLTCDDDSPPAYSTITQPSPPPNTGQYI